jgi:hypothetical protein
MRATMKPKSVVFMLLLLCGCGSATLDPIVKAAGPIPFPTAGGTIVLQPGEYACPASISSGTHIIGRGALVPPELLAARNFAPIALNGSVAVVRVICNHGLIIKDASDVQISGVIFDFRGTGGLTLDSVSYSRFDMGLVDADTALTLTTNDGNTFSNLFPRLVLYKHNTGIVLNGVASKDVTWNDFGPIDIVDTRQVGVVISQFSDTNTFSALRMHLLGTAQDGLVFNDSGSLADIDASGNMFQLVNCDAEPGFAGYCAHFKGYTTGNRLRMGFGIMSDANKVKFENAFSASANIVEKMQEQPKTP